MPYRPATVSMYARVWRSFLRFCHTEQLCAEDLARYIKPPRTDPRREPLLGVAELRALLLAARSGKNPGRDEAMLLVMYDCGLRAGEICALTINGVDFGSRVVTVPTGKTGGRTVPFGMMTARALRRHLRERGSRPADDAPLFASSATGDALTRYTLRDVLKRLGTRAGIRVHAHQFRHSFAVAYLQNGGDTFSLQRILGHSSLQMTRWYAELADTDVQARHALASPADRLVRSSRR